MRTGRRSLVGQRVVDQEELIDEYLFKKDCHLPHGLAYVAENLQLIEPGSPVLMETTAFFNVALGMHC